MGITIVTNDEEGMIEVTYSPDPVRDADLREQRKLVAEAMQKSGISRVLLDASSLSKFPSILTSLEHNRSVAADKQLRKAKFAVLCSSIGEDERSLEITGRNRGVVIKCVTSREDALAWLKG